MATDDVYDFYRGGPRKVSGPPVLWTMDFLSFMMVNLFVFMGFDLLLPTLSLYLEAHGNTEAEIGRIFGTFMVASISMRMLASRLAGRWNALGLVRLGIFGCAVAGFSYYWAYTVPTGMAARFLHGAGFGLSSTMVTTLASQIIPPARLGEGMGYLGLGGTLALAVGPFLGLWLLEKFGYFVLFAAVAACYGVSILLVSRLPKIRLASAEPGAPKPKLTLVSGRVLAPSFLMFLTGAAMAAVSIYLALYCREKGLPYAGHFFVFSTIGIFSSRFTAGRFYDRFGHRFVLIPAGLLFLACMVLLYRVETKEGLIFISIVYGLSTGALFPGLQALTLSSVPLSGRTEATASFFNSFDLGIGLGSMLLGILAGRMGTYGSVYLGGAGAALLWLIFYVMYYVILRRGGRK